MDSFDSHYLFFSDNDSSVMDQRLGPCELQDPVWAKMSALAAGVSKKRKKSETKPQAQINKCNNEKRRREQENIYIEELAELISANFADMSSLSVKPDKCAILQETVNQIRSIKHRESSAQPSDPVQQGEVSSSRPTILSNEVYGPLLLEALEGFLFVIDGVGKVEYVTENISTYIKHTKEDVFGQSIYKFLHMNDHVRFNHNITPMTVGWGREEQSNRSRSFSIRFVLKTSEEFQRRLQSDPSLSPPTELMHISSTQLRDQVAVNPDDEGNSGDSGPYLLCVASRISHRDKATSGIEQFTTKLDTSGKIIGVDASGVSAQYSQFINKDLMDRALRDLVPQQEVQKLATHLRDTLSAGQSTSTVYRLQLEQDKYVQVQTKSKLFKTNPHATNDTDFIMATHSILSENDAIGPSDPGGGGAAPTNSGVGGPLMTSVVNGARNGTPVSSGSDSSTASSSNNALLNSAASNTATSFSTNFGMDHDFGFDIFPTSSTWGDLDGTSWNEPRPESRQSTTPVSTPTPRPPSNPAYSPAAATATVTAQSPLASYGAHPSPSTPAATNPYSNTFPFSPLTEQNYPPVDEQKDTKANVMEDSGRLRILLTKPPTTADSSANAANDADGRGKNRILKGLLNQRDEDDTRNDNRASPRGGLMNRSGSIAGPSELPKTSTSGVNNTMLLELLNEKSDDDDLEAKAGVKKKSELLQQLLKTPENRENDEDKKNDLPSQEDSLLRSLGFTGSPSSPGGEPGKARKRPSDDRDDNPNKRTGDGSQVSSTGSSSKLCERNKMLASLLAKQPNNHQPIPPIPASVISATPQEKLPRVTLEPNKTLPPRLMNQNLSQQQSNVINNVRVNNNARMGVRQQASYLTSMLGPNNNIQQQRSTENRQLVNSGCYTSPATSSTDNNVTWSDNNNQMSDPFLSDILDQVIDIVPEDMMLLDGSEGQQNNNFQQGLSEKMAINIIQKSLMQIESTVKSPSSPTISMPGTPPAYSSASMTTSNSRSFPPPPNYHQSNFGKQRMPTRQGQMQYVMAGASGNANAQILLQQQRKQQQLLQQQQQQEQKRRLLQRQQQQELLIPSNATTAEISSGLQNLDTLLAPNVTLQRSSSLPESQLSPGYAGQLNQQQNQRIGNQQQQQPYSPHSQLVSPLGQQQGGFPQTTLGNYQQARLSPQTPFNQQLSPRQAYPQQGGQGQNWQQSQARLSLQNPMLNAQLTGNHVSGGPNGRNFQRAPTQPQQQQQQQQQRSLNSPGAVTSRHSPYPADSFPPPTSPNSGGFNQSQYLRLQRANSAPTATTQLPGVSGSGPTSEFVRQELRAVVGARTGQAQTAPSNRPPSQLMNQQQVDLEALGLTFEMPTSGAESTCVASDLPRGRPPLSSEAAKVLLQGVRTMTSLLRAGASDSPKLWGAMGSDMSSMSPPQPATSRSTMEEGRGGDHPNKSSLLQKLLSE